MPKKRDRKQKPAQPSNAAVARYWRQGDESDEAWDKFHDAVLLLLEEGKMNHKRCEAIMSRLPVDEVGDFMSDVETIACKADRVVMVDGQDGPEPAFASVGLFGVPVTGTLEAVEELCRNRERFDMLARAVRATGYSASQSNICLLPVPIALHDLAAASPDEIHQVAEAGLQSFLGQDNAPRDAASVLREIKQRNESSSSGGGVTLVNRVLIGVQMKVMEDLDLDDDDIDEILGELDALGILQNGGSEEMDEVESSILEDAVDRWRHFMESEVETEGLGIHTPVPWSDIRHTLLSNHVGSAISTALQAAGKTCDPSEVEVDLALDDTILTITASHDGAFLTRIPFPHLFIFDGLEEFLADLEDAYRLRDADASHLDVPTLH